MSCANCLISDVDFSSRFRAEWLNSKDATEKPANRNPKGHGFSFGFRGGAPSPPADGKLEGRFVFDGVFVSKVAIWPPPTDATHKAPAHHLSAPVLTLTGCLFGSPTAAKGGC